MPETTEAERITAVPDLRPKVRELPHGSPDPVARAEAAVAALAHHFDDWMAEETARVLACRDAFAASDYADDAAREALHRAAHDLKGEAATLGFPLAARVAASLSALIAATAPGARPPAGLVDSHVDAIRAMVREGAKGPDDPLGGALAEALERATGDHLGD